MRARLGIDTHLFLVQNWSSLFLHLVNCDFLISVYLFARKFAWWRLIATCRVSPGLNVAEMACKIENTEL